MILKIDDILQFMLYCILPKRQIDLLYIQLPYAVHYKIDDWIESSDVKDIYLVFKNSQFTFLRSKINKQEIRKNIYGVDCRHLYIDFSVMKIGVHK